jgi:hypothetical protein
VSQAGRNATRNDVVASAISSLRLADSLGKAVFSPYVIINGTIVVKKAMCCPSNPASPTRFPTEAKRRFEPLDRNECLGEYTIHVPGMSELDDTGGAKPAAD